MGRLYNKFIILAILTLLSGCSWVQSKNFNSFFSKKKNQKPVVSSQPQSLKKVNFIQKGHIVDFAKFKQGGNVAIIPFKAGVGVEATERLDRIALRVVKGVADVLHEKGSQFKVVIGEDANKADFVITGHVTKMGSPLVVKKILLGKSKIYLKAEGRMIHRRTGALIMFFADEQSGQQKRIDYNHLGYTIGENIGKFISSGVNE